ncbi:MAG: heparinase II/III family protein, partial [Planctomycetota bacterium]
MQSLNWYVRRLRAMQPKEVTWRAKSALRDLFDRPMVRRRGRLQPMTKLLSDHHTDARRGFRVTDMVIGAWTPSQFGTVEREWLDRLLQNADKIAAHRLSFLDLKNSYLGDPIDFNRDHKSGKPSPMSFAPWIDYRDLNATGDCKYIWEPNRHHQLVVLARAYRATGNIHYAEALVEQLDSWLDQCPFGIGMQWRSALELGIRLINWIWALDMIRESRLIRPPFKTRLLNAVYRHIWEVA